MLSIKIILQSKVTINQVRTKKPCFRCFSRFVTRVLTLRPIDFLEHYLIFTTFKPLSVPFRIQKKGHSILHYFLSKQTNYLLSECTSLVLRSKSVQQYYLYVFKDLNSKCALFNKTKITTENAFNRDHCWIEGNQELDNAENADGEVLKCWYGILLFQSFRLTTGRFPHSSFSQEKRDWDYYSTLSQYVLDHLIH